MRTRTFHFEVLSKKDGNTRRQVSRRAISEQGARTISENYLQPGEVLGSLLMVSE